ncbi:hypothetical protein ACFX2J_014505 [Malus domestica]
MGAICCLEKAGLPLHQGSSQNDGRKGQTFFRGVKEKGDRTSQDRRSAKREFLQAEIQVCFERPAYLYKNQHAMGFQRSKRRAQKSKKPIQKSKRHQLSQKLGLLTNHRFQISKSVSFLSLVSTRHMQTQLCENHGQFVEAPIPTICLSQPRQHLSHAEKALRKSRAVCRSADSNHLSFSTSSALRKSRAICRRFLLK